MNHLDNYKTYIVSAAQIACGIFFFYNGDKELGTLLILSGLGQAALRHGVGKK